MITNIYIWVGICESRGYIGQTARRNGKIFVRSYLALKKELIEHFSVFLANCLGHHQNFEAQKGKY